LRGKRENNIASLYPTGLTKLKTRPNLGFIISAVDERRD